VCVVRVRGKYDERYNVVSSVVRMRGTSEIRDVSVSGSST